ncbi:lyso-ornithine lipid acyltransferase [Aureimonas phyllosphaerae]|uniref:1-acyl-sn-glycerol-3-phosphate acyltransferase n=1 Tax=Aureimonas phyllosphaerae TaxID=1166078 RepID=A0A7W6FVR6_9HYPH|nr:1-acyl-sn-glycerol-3-phosphate acyltransferase [Aureimonas phyllosphaerae]MBB3961461.1 1-acyl-sn-glycerol-3-phosphate acyltransferase [Aureimonas phyllosphaerae]SFF38392.1 lyso-ornithine lipid acyltransferase [Aureimonas phyllosphaerae]
MALTDHAGARVAETGSPSRDPVAQARLAAIALVLALTTLVLTPLQLLAIRFRWKLAGHLPFLWQRIAARVAGLRVHRRGAPAAGRPLLLVSNHQSWADIMALGSVMPLSFIAKSDVEGWPIFGLLARLQRTVFVERGARGRTGAQADSIAERLGAGDAMVLFAEGTTSDGNTVLPFKTALFGAAQAALKASGADAVLVQPVAIAYVGANGMALGRFGRPLAAWPGEVELMPHLSAFLREGAIDVEISFGEPIRVTPGSDRKAVARRCEAEVRRMLLASLGFPSADETARNP